MAFPTQMLRTTDGQADAHGDDLSILYGAGRCFFCGRGVSSRAGKRWVFQKFGGLLRHLFCLKWKKGVSDCVRVFSSLYFWM